MATRPEPPRLVVVTDYPDGIILGNLRKNVDRNMNRFTATCKVRWLGHKWGEDVTSLTLVPDSLDDIFTSLKRLTVNHY
jgi:nicotinamide N-methyltransferase